MISSLCLSMIFSENRFPLFRIMLRPDQAIVGPLALLFRPATAHYYHRPLAAA
jgi:hypothetical protein